MRDWVVRFTPPVVYLRVCLQRGVYLRGVVDEPHYSSSSCRFLYGEAILELNLGAVVLCHQGAFAIDGKR